MSTLLAVAMALDVSSKVPVLTYHSSENYYDEATMGCDTESAALERDLALIHSMGFTVIPAYWLVEWQRGWRGGNTLPDRSVVITFDDGHNADFLDNADPWHPCAPIKSMRAVLEEAATWDWSPTYGAPVPHATTFVIGSPTAREHIKGDMMSDAWWSAASAHPLMEVQNHSLDHDHESIPEDTLDEKLDVLLPAGGGKPRMTSTRISSFDQSTDYVTVSAEYIEQKTGLWPDLFAYPFGPASSFMRDVYFPEQFEQHGTVAAFCGAGGYVTKESNPYCLERFVHRASPQYGGWRDEHELEAILRGAMK